MFRSLRIGLCLLLTLGQSFQLLICHNAIGQTRRGSSVRQKQVDSKSGLRVKLREGTPMSESLFANPTASAALLSDDDTQKVLKRLQPLKSDPTDDQEFALRDRS